VEGKRVAVDKPAEREDKRVERPEEPKVAERRVAKPEVPAIQGSGTIREDATRTTVPDRVNNRVSLAIRIDSSSFSNKQ
jgi:hypothetical protein